MLRSKPFLTYFLICAVPLLLLAALNYWNASRSVDHTVETIVQNDLNSFTAAVDRLLDDQGKEVLRVASSNTQRLSNAAVTPMTAPQGVATIHDNTFFKSLMMYDADRRPQWFTNDSPPVPDDRVWTTQGNVLLERLVEDKAGNARLEFCTPIQNETGLGNEGAVVGIVDLPRLLAAAARTLDSTSTRNASAPRILVTDRKNTAIYESASTSPLSGVVTTSAPMPRLKLTVAISRSTAEFVSPARMRDIAGFVIALLLAALAAFVLDRHVRARSRGIARVEEDLSAIARGDIDRKIVLQSSDEARAMADDINAMTAQLRAQIAREEESRQFDSFVRISAMLTHDLKNAIEGLSLTVNNMERHFDNEQFRIDALKGLTSATDKLKALVARLSRPVNTLSGEHKRPTETDLVPILKHVMALTAEPARGKHTIQTKLPDKLYALADAARVEEVIENLILNALEAMGDNRGTLTVEAGPDASGAPAFAVTDTGPGMSPTFIENRLFRPFATTKKNGIGLGLYTCREVIRASGGSIDVQSVEGAGTTFRVVLPSIPQRQA
jgi:signal transduction histidine kinase/lipopolysaccharide export system protein LptC